MLLTVKLDPVHATLEDVRKRLKLGKDDLDESFGVVSIDPAEHLFAVLVEEDAANQASEDPDVEGPYSNPRIEGFGLSATD
jgi:hypothetical protein